jgi:hypothetical protein
VLLDWTTVRASSATGLGEKVQQVLAERGETSQLHSIQRWLPRKGYLEAASATE